MNPGCPRSRLCGLGNHNHPPTDRTLERRTQPMNHLHVPLARVATFALLALALTGCRPHDFPQYQAGYREYAYVTNGGSNTVTILDVVNVRLDRELAVGQNPIAVAASPPARKSMWSIPA